MLGGSQGYESKRESVGGLRSWSELGVPEGSQGKSITDSAIASPALVKTPQKRLSYLIASSRNVRSPECRTVRARMLSQFLGMLLPCETFDVSHWNEGS